MPYKNYMDKIRYNNFHNPNRVNSSKYGRINLNNIKNRTYICELCNEFGNTEFHEYNDYNPENVLELCIFCHKQITLQKFDESKIFQKDEYETINFIR